MADPSTPVEAPDEIDAASSVDWLHGQPYPAWARDRQAECPVVASSSGMFGSGTSYQVLRYADAETVLRDPDTFSSSINAQHIGQFMGDLILAMNGPEHRTYRNLVAKAFRASQLERWDETLVQPTIDRLLERDRPARARRPRRVGHVGVSGASDLRHRGSAARRRRAVRALGRADQHRAVGARGGHGGVAGDGRLPAAARRGAPGRPDRRLPLRPRARTGRRRATHRLQDLRVPPAAVAGRRGDDVPRHGELPVRVAVTPRRPRGSTPTGSCCRR